MVHTLDQALSHLAQRSGNPALADHPGAGAAGGLGFAMLAFFGARLRPGVEIVIEATQLRSRLKAADLCITGEGRFDDSSLAGKTPVGVGRACADAGVPCVALAGAVSVAQPPAGFGAVLPICRRPMDLPAALAEAADSLSAAAENALRLFLAGRLRPAAASRETTA